MDLGLLVLYLILGTFITWSILMAVSIGGFPWRRRTTTLGGLNITRRLIEIDEQLKQLISMLPEADYKVLEVVEKYGEIRVPDIVGEVGESGVVVGQRVIRLAEKGYVRVTETGTVLLTEMGERALLAYKEKKYFRRKEKEHYKHEEAIP